MSIKKQTSSRLRLNSKVKPCVLVVCGNIYRLTFGQNLRRHAILRAPRALSLARYSQRTHELQHHIWMVFHIYAARTFSTQFNAFWDLETNKKIPLTLSTLYYLFYQFQCGSRAIHQKDQYYFDFDLFTISKTLRAYIVVWVLRVLFTANTFPLNTYSQTMV